MFVDSHCHLELEEYDKDRENVIDQALRDGITRMVTVATEERYFGKATAIAETHPGIYAAIGVHPHNAESYSDALEHVIQGYLGHPKVVGYGEIGLDFYRDYAPRDIQLEVFRKQIEIGRQAGLPLIIHSRNAKTETLSVLKEARLDGYRVIVHCYSYDVETARVLLDMGAFLSFPGTITYKNSDLPGVVKYVPLNRILTETDAPFLTPHPHRGKRNQPAFVKLVLEDIARIKDVPVEEAASIVGETFGAVFLLATKEAA